MSAQQSLDAEGGIDLGIPVRAVNRSTSDITWQYDRKTYVLRPDVPTYVPYMAMVYWQGDPRAIDLPGGRMHEQHRRQQREHLRVLYGVYEFEERWADIPLVECYPIDSDVPFNTVLRDPEGTSLSEQTGDITQRQAMQEQMERMAAQMRVMQATIANMEQQEAAITAGSPMDLDRQETTSRAISPEEATGRSMVGPAPERRAPAPKSSTAQRAGADVPVTRDE